MLVDRRAHFADIFKKRNRGCEARQIMLHLAALHCRGRYTLTEIAERLGQRDQVIRVALDSSNFNVNWLCLVFQD